uniref:Uncharacterized protein n=1 Tax=Nelumbo nucifera TaxID=4432 RepID=A0A822YKJ4_NELNU|nr:TPA_asm: hypothetical protein HUJ06_031336 [Nelumbo nucifera]
MVWCFPSTTTKLAMTIACFTAAASLFAAGVRLSFLSIAPQQARIKSRNDFIKDCLMNKHGQ